MHRRLNDIHKRRCCHGALQSRISHHSIPGAVLHNPIKISRCALCPCLPTRLSVCLSIDGRFGVLLQCRTRQDQFHFPYFEARGGLEG